jgi:hypothetical protein
MPKHNLTDRTLKALKPAKSEQRYEIMDKVVPGFGVRVTDKGRRTFILIARYPGSDNPTRRALGEYGELTLEDAREKARGWIKLISKGVDPADEDERQRIAEQRKRANTFGAVAEDFITEKLPVERKGQEVERDIRREFIPPWGDRPVVEITASDVRAVIKAVKDRGAPYQAHNLLGHARRLFAWAIDQQAYGLEASPCDRLKPKAIIGKKRSRTRILSDDEIRAFWRAASRLSYPYGPTARLLLLTGQRHNEVAKAKRSEFHPELIALLRRHADTEEPIAWRAMKAEWKLWSVGEERFKSDAPHMVALSDDACSVLETLPLFSKANHLFSTTFGEKPTVISDKIKRRLDAYMLCALRLQARKRGEDPAKVELRPWIIHDLRRTLRTHLSALRTPEHVSEMVIGHGRKGIERVYDQHRYIDEMREALTAWAARLRAILEPQPISNVVALRA